VIEALEEFDVLYVESFVLDEWHAEWRHWGTQPSDDLQVLIRDAQIDEFMRTMAAAEYLPAMFDPGTGQCKPMAPGLAKQAVLRLPVSPEPFYVHPSWLSPTGEPVLLVRFHTTRRHGRLLLADLEEWFGQKEECAVMGDTAYATEVYRPPLWAMMLWQAGEIMNHASDFFINHDEVEKLGVVAVHQTDWAQVVAKASRYCHEYDERINRPTARRLLADYKQRIGSTLGVSISEDDLQRSEREYGALYELSHAIRALIDYGRPYRAAVPDGLWERLEPFTEHRPRKLWWYEGGQEDVPPQTTLGRLGIAVPAFGIHAQVTSHPSDNFGALLRQGLIELAISNAPPDQPWAPPHGPWSGRTQAEVDAILSFPVP
jgi:hypothetical protein